MSLTCSGKILTGGLVLFRSWIIACQRPLQVPDLFNQNHHWLSRWYSTLHFCRTGILVVLAGLVTSQARLDAHPGHSHAHSMAIPANNLRNWTDVVRAVHFQGFFVAVKENQVQIRRTDESLVNLPFLDLAKEDRDWITERVDQIRRRNEELGRRPFAILIQAELDDVEDEESSMKNLIAANQLPQLLAQSDPAKPRLPKNNDDNMPEIAKAFEAFVKTKAIKTRWDQNYFYVESNGLPDHQMMVGITAWQQQVPLPQTYTGENSWRIPLHPIPAKNPISAKNHFLRGAIAIAANGVPIFNPLNNRGDDALLFGELDEFGGHCGRADDYHYHIAPVHLAKAVGEGLPIAYALDGYPIYGYEELDGSKVKDLDAFNGHKDRNGNYHYHATKTYPYLNGGFHGEVIERGGQVDPQPRAEPIRPDTRPLRDAKIVDFVETKPGSYQLTYEVRGAKGTVSYVLDSDGSVKFTFVDPSGSSKTETYSPKGRGPGGDHRPLPPPPPPRDRRRPPDQ